MQWHTSHDGVCWWQRPSIPTCAQGRSRAMEVTTSLGPCGSLPLSAKSLKPTKHVVNTA